MAETVRDNAARQRFEIDSDGHTAFVTYRAIPGGLFLIHTETPAELRGRGIATRLARGVLETIRARGEKVRIGCDFLADFMRRNPEFDDLLM
ncbi:MAG TPA: GNAT family N-acetyltransferase [Stellaceae bacterium]